MRDMISSNIKKSILPLKKLGTIAFVFFSLAISNVTAYAQGAPDVQFEVAKHRLVESIKTENHRQTLKLIEDLRAMNRPLVADVDFFEGNAHNALGKDEEAAAALTRYIESAGTKGRNYKPAIAMLSKIMERKDAKEAAARRAEEDRQRRAEAHSAMLAASARVGEVSRVNTEWGYAVVKVDAGADALSGPTLYVLTDNGQRIDLKPGKLNGNDLSATSAQAASLSAGMVVYTGPAGGSAHAPQKTSALAGLGPTAVQVTSVAPGSSAATSGYQVGDVITSVYVPDVNSEIKIRNKNGFLGLAGRATATNGRRTGGAMALLGASSAPSPMAGGPSPSGASPAQTSALWQALGGGIAGDLEGSSANKNFVVKILRGGSEVSIQGMNINGLELTEVPTTSLTNR